MKKTISRIENLHDAVAVIAFVLIIFSWMLIAEDGLNIVNGLFNIWGLSMIGCCKGISVILEDLYEKSKL